MGGQNERMRGGMRGGMRGRRLSGSITNYVASHTTTPRRARRIRRTQQPTCAHSQTHAHTMVHTHTHTTGWARLIHHIPALRHFLGKPAFDGHAALAVVPLRTLGLPRAHVFRRRVCRGREVPLVDLAPIACTFRAIPRLPPALRRRPIRAPRDAVIPGRT